jgi:hypothetical protein
MKRTIFILLLFFSFTRIFAQIPTAVYDARSDIHQTNNYLLSLKNFGQAVQQSALLNDTYKLFQNAQKVLTKVNRAVNDYYVVQDIVKGQIEAIKLYGYYYSQARGFTHVDRAKVTSFINLLTTLNSECASLIKHADLILQPDYFTMSDADRMRFLSEAKDKISDTKTIMTINYKKLKADEDEAALREMMSYNYKSNNNLSIKI